MLDFKLFIINFNSYLIIIIFALLFSSCLKEEKPIPPHETGDINTVQIEINFPYENQVFYNCNLNKIVSSNSRFSWDLAFESRGNHIKLNIAKAMFAHNLGPVNFENVTSIENPTWLWDNANGNLDSLALNDYLINPNNVFIIDRGYDNNGNHFGYYKFKVQEVTDQKFVFKYAKLDNSEENTTTILKDETLNFMSFSFNNGGTQVNIEPNKNTWDLLFTNHQHYFSNLPLPFVLTQCLSNKYNGVLIAEIKNDEFSKISLKDIDKYTFTDHLDEIGYDWKIRNSQDNSFEINPDIFFIVKTKEGWFFKLRFIDFYDTQGKKGYPKFEIQKL